VPDLLAHSRPALVQVTLAVLTLIGFALATARVASGWPLAALGWLLGMVRAAFFGQWSRLVNPLHEVGAGLWIGTLFVLIAVGLPTALRSGLAPARRGTLAAGMIHAFSPFALGSASLLAVFGVVTAVLHLKRLDALWTTPYGWTFIAKLAVAGLGAYHWRAVRPRLGTESAAADLQRSARLELIAAVIVLVLTAVLVSLPSPKPPGS
jgi:copper transport protein